MDVKSVILALFLAGLDEGLIEYLFGTPMDKIAALKPYKWLLMYLSALAGIGLAFWYQLDLSALIPGVTVSWVGMLLTGIMLGRGANYVHDIIKTYLVKPA
jgi:hypothetical protein